jgi:hypothetical protein
MRIAGRGRVRVMWMDEARIGQQGTLTTVWALKGSRPTAIKQTKFDWAYAYKAVEPATGFSSAIIAPHVNTTTMNAFLHVQSSEVDAGDFVILIMDQAGRGLAQESSVGRARHHRDPAPATLQPRTEPGREPVGVHAQPPPQQPRTPRLRPHP